MTQYTHLYREARKSAAKRIIPFTLTPNEFDSLIVRSAGCCMMTGIPFEFDRHPTAWRRPFAPSIDRIDSAKGYTAGNIRLVCVLVNLALNEWGLEPLMRVARNLVQREQELHEQTKSRKYWQAAGYYSTKEYLAEIGLALTPIAIGMITRRASEYCRQYGIERQLIERIPGRPEKLYPRAVLETAMQAMGLL